VITVPPKAPAVPVPVIQKENCSAADGAFTLSAIGGNAPYTYTTLPGNALGNVVSGLSSGIYTIIIGDANGCKDTGTVFVGNLSSVSLNVLTVTPVKCYNVCDGSVILNVANATPPVTYSITGRAITTNTVITNLCSGFYLVKAMDSNGCPAFDTIDFPTPPAFTYSGTSSAAAICIGKKAQLRANANGGSGSLTYHWNPGALTGATVDVQPVTTTTYSLNVYDSQGCTQAPYPVTVNVNPKLVISINSSNSGICPGTTAQITPTISGGDGNYTYFWLPGGGHGSSIFVENITIPTYTLTVGDGCGTPKESKEITIKLHPVTKPLYKELGQAGCVPYCATFINITPGSKNAIWNYGDQPLERLEDTTLHCYNKAGNFNLRLTVTDSNSCRASYTYTNAIQVLPRPEVDYITEPGVITLNDAENVLLKNTGDMALTYQWYVNTIPAGNSRNIYYTFRDTGCYDIKLLMENESQCRDSSTRSICVFEGFNFYMPNAFSPNNDGLNDVLLPKGTGWLYDNYVFEIYNRWGYKVFSTNDVNQGWDGGAQMDQFKLDVLKAGPNNVYNWRAVVTDNLQKEHEMRGSVMLVK
jgi:gliding motility-associated-like protein